MTYQGETLWLKRTPAAKLPRTGKQALLASDTASLLSRAQSDSLFRTLSVVRAQSPRWRTVAYQQEACAYEQIQVQRQLRKLKQQFTQTQHQLDSLRAGAQAWEAAASFRQAAQAGQAAQRWAQAEVYLARCLALHPANAALRARHALVSEQCVWYYFTRFCARQPTRARTSPNQHHAAATLGTGLLRGPAPSGLLPGGARAD